MDVGLRLAGQGRTVELVEIDGPMRAGVQVLQGASAVVQGNHFAVQGTGVMMAGGSHATLMGNVFLRTGRAPSAAIAASDPSQATLRRNLFAGYGATPVKGLTPAQTKPLLSGNVVLEAEPSLAR